MRGNYYEIIHRPDQIPHQITTKIMHTQYPLNTLWLVFGTSVSKSPIYAHTGTKNKPKRVKPKRVMSRCLTLQFKLRSR